jgi:hypothetical protein
VKSTKTLGRSNWSVFACVMMEHRSLGAFSARGRARLYRLPKKSFGEDFGQGTNFSRVDEPA